MTIEALEYDLFKLEGYSLKEQGNRTRICEGPVLICIQACMRNFNCRAMAFAGNDKRCEAVRFVLFGRILVNRKENSTLWVKSMLLI